MPIPSRTRSSSGAGALAVFALATVTLLARATPAVSGVAPEARAPGSPIVAGMPLLEALRELELRGLPLIFSTLLVTPEMRVLSTPPPEAPRDTLDRILRPHGLVVLAGEGGHLLVVRSVQAALHGTVRSRQERQPLAGVTVTALESGGSTLTDGEGRYRLDGLAPGRWTLQARHPRFVIEQAEPVELGAGGELELAFLLQAAPFAGEEITVQPSRVSLLGDEPAAPFTLGEREIQGLPQLGDDVFRALGLLPGTASNDISAQIQVRGGRRDELLVLLDGQELYDAYHLRDFDSALSIVPSSGLGSVEVATGSFPPRYGDRMGGVLDMVTSPPVAPRRFRLSASLLALQAEGSGVGGRRMGWLLSVRRGVADLAARYFDRPEDPVFWDLLAKVDGRPSERHYWRGNLVRSGDRLDYVEDVDDELTSQDTAYDSSYFWLAHQAIGSDRYFVDSALSYSATSRDRGGHEDEAEKRVDVADRRTLDVFALTQSWSLRAGPRQDLTAGFELRRFDADFDYASTREIFTPLGSIHAAPSAGSFAYRGAVADDYLGAHLVDRVRIAPGLLVDLGIRFDRHSHTGDADWSPRAQLAWKAAEEWTLRAGWGHFHQSQRPYELMVEDADTHFYPSELTEQWVLSGERRFARARPGNPVTLRLEAYRRRLLEPRPRYENLYEPFAPFPEAALDRYRFAPDGGKLSGLELFLEGRPHRRFRWWLNYGWSRAEDRIDGEVVPRLVDQRHAANATFATVLGGGWELALAYRFHTGWPTTPIALETGTDEEGEPEFLPVLGPINSERLPDYHRLDLRLSRSWEVSIGSLRFFVDVQNVYDRENVAGYDLEIDEDEGAIVFDEESWPGFFASLGIIWEF